MQVVYSFNIASMNKKIELVKGVYTQVAESGSALGVYTQVAESGSALGLRTICWHNLGIIG